MSVSARKSTRRSTRNERGEGQAAIATSLGRLAPAERRVAEVALRDPELLAFGTVAAVAQAAGTSGPSVVRLASRLGFAGFVGLQQAVRRDLRRRLHPAVERIRASRPGAGDLRTRALEIETANVRSSLEAIDARSFETAVARLADPRHRVSVVPSEQMRGIGIGLATELSILRDGVRLLEGSEFRLVSQLARLGRSDTVVLLDFRRHERWLVAAARRIAKQGCARIALVNSELSPLAEGALAVFPIAASAAGPFDSHVGLLAVVNTLVAGVAERLRASATRRIDALEAIWVESGALVED